ncbi:Transcription factor bHLH144 [Raphanus sativus]|nr:Transcription factor bHLH144 [Raphanus sativus]
MQNNQFPHYSDDMGDGNMNYPYDGNMNYPYPYASASSFDDLFPPCAKLPFHGVELQPSPVCPKNFVIFDQTYDHNSQVMYHPDLTPRLVNSGLASTFQNEYVGGGYGGSYGNYGQEKRSSARLVTLLRGSMGIHRLRLVTQVMGVTAAQEGSRVRQEVLLIVPGGEEMNTASVLDEAVQYLKSLKLEAQKLGHFSNQS